MGVELLDIPALLRVPFLKKGRDLDGWDCGGCALWLTRTAFGVGLPDFLDGYDGTDRVHAPAMAATIQAHIDLFEPCAPQAGAWLLFRSFGVACHIGWALDATTMVHADDAGVAQGRFSAVAGGGTYCERFDQGKWKSRLLEVRLPRAMIGGGTAR
ncbi:hypothetical protein sos41_11940 [Alphaproteobacteria bacterium SO-S41]|nr:hypothetical protein sos41_11940 [Alphaproteobacteria bacterium SO-S41]